MAPYWLIIAAALIGLVFRGPLGLLIGAVGGYLAAIAIGRVLILMDGGILPRRVRREVCKRFIRTNGEIVSAAIPNAPEATALQAVEKTIERIFRRAASMNPSMNQELAYARQSMLGAGADLLDEESRPEWRTLLVALLSHLEQDLYARPADEERDAKFEAFERPGNDETSQLLTRFEKATWLTSRANAMGTIGRFDDAIRDLREAIAIYPLHAPAYASLGIALRELGRLREALEVLETAPQRVPYVATGKTYSTVLDIYPVMATVYMLLGDREKLLECARRAVEAGHDPVRDEMHATAQRIGTIAPGPSHDDEMIATMEAMIRDFAGASAQGDGHERA